jgi:hypothetical protein
MNVTVSLNTGGSATAGVDRQALVDNIQAEVEKLASASGAAAPSTTYTEAPAGAQGDIFSVHWLLHLAQTPNMIKVYINGLVFALNSIASSARRPDASDKNGDEKANPPLVKVDVLGKEFLLPASVAVIQSILDSIHWG